MRTLPRVILALSLLLVGCPKRVTVNGQEMSASEANELARRDMEAARTERRPEVAADRLEAVANRYFDVPAAAEALYQAGLLWREAKKPERARADFAAVATRHPTSPWAPQAKYRLGLIDLEAGRFQDALAALSSIQDQLPPADRLEAARAAARAAEGAHAWPQAARFRAEAARLSQGEERARELARAVEHVETRLAPPELGKLRQELPNDSPLLPALSMKLARAQLQSGDTAGAELSAREVLERGPDSKYAPEAKQLLDRLSRRSAPANPRVIGVAVPLSGRQKAWGEAVLQGVQLALGDDGAFTVVVKDTRGEPDGAQAALDELATGESAVAALGGVVNAEAPRAAAAANGQGLPFVSLSRAEDVTAAGPFVFRNMLTAQAQARALAELAMVRRGMKRFALLYPQIPYGQELAQAFWDEIDAHGGEVRAAESYEHDRTTFGPLVKSMVGKLWLDERQDYLSRVAEIAKSETDPYRRRKAVERARSQLPPITDFDAVFIPDFAKNVVLIAPALAVEDVATQTCDPREVERIRRVTGRPDLQPVQLLGANGWDDPALVEKAGRYVECAIFVDGFFAASERPETKAFVTSFQAKYGHPPSILEASAYDAARMLRKVLEAGAKSREAVREGLAALRGFPGATGELSFDARREVTKPLFYLTVEKGVLRELTPQEVGAPGPGGS